MSTAPPWPAPLTARSLRERWQGRLTGAGVAPALAAATWDDLAAAYGAVDRAYHTLEHIGEVLAWIDRLEPAPSLPLELAACAHDVVYVPTAPDSEARSAGWVRDRFASHLDDGAVERTCELVLVTVHHDPPVDDHDATVLVDADLSVLGAPVDRYRRYSTDVRAEYGHLDDSAWAVGRARVLRSLLGRGRVFHDPRLGGVEDRARQNLGSELAALATTDTNPAQPGSP